MFTSTNSSDIIGFLQLLTLQREFSEALIGLIRHAEKEQYFHTIIYANCEDEIQCQATLPACDISTIAQGLNVPMIQIKWNASLHLASWLNREVFTLMPMSGIGSRDEEMLENLWVILRNNVKSRLLLLFGETAKDEYIWRILKFCCDHSAINVVALKQNFLHTQVFYTPKLFPEFEILTRTFEILSPQILYHDQVKNMFGFPLLLRLNKKNTRAYIIENADNKLTLGGHLGHFFEEFAKWHNATISLPGYNLDADSAPFQILELFLANGSYNMIMSLYLTNLGSDIVFSNIYDFEDWCVMVPTERFFPAYMFYGKIFSRRIALLIVSVVLILAVLIAVTYWLEGYSLHLKIVALKVYVFNGVLGQSFQTDTRFTGVRSCLCLLAFLLGIIINTTYVAYLQTYNTEPPAEKALNTWDDIRASETQMALFEGEIASVAYFDETILTRIRIKIYSNQSEFFELRDGFDTRYVYPVPSPQWSIYDQQQKFFSKPKFRLSNICFVKTSGLRVPMEPNSMFEEAVNFMSAQIFETGLLTYWKALAFIEGVRMKRITLLDTSILRGFVPMKIEDMKLFALVYVAMIAISSLCFIGEVCWFQRRECACVLFRKINILKQG
ncbi:uncharacterized protein LOC131994804 [Stomoxys calcitrans]|uniref:uncharacterized protein LOC131994804 n=1 Tax=Stomoxys calcitrans TaxID=35570 RepID=UPI0027E2D013|nr:uncharacterized protein LOC131994804 [Stomoxys calcitrans]